MQIDLFKDADIMLNMQRNNGKMENQPFEAAASLDVVKDMNTIVWIKASELMQKSRIYEFKASGSCDQMFLLTALGIEKNWKGFATIIDFSNSLDYVLHRICGCSVESVRLLENYDSVSSDIINLRFENLSGFTFGQLCKLDDHINEYLMETLKKKREMFSQPNRVMGEMTLQFYVDVLSCITEIKDYCAYCLNKQYRSQCVYKSKSYSSAVLYTGDDLSGELLLVQDGYKEYSLSIKSYKQFEYAMEV